MASVQYLFSRTEELQFEINEKKTIFDSLVKFRNLCTVVIQKIWRGYSSRKKYLKVRWSIITVQSYFRGWVVRKNRAKYVEQHEADMMVLRRNRAATKIQAAYRGYLVRKYLRMRTGTPAERLKKLKELNERGKLMQNYIRSRFMENSKVHRENEHNAIKNRIMYLLFKWHHLIRTDMIQGVYSYRNSKKLTVIEEMMKTMSFKEHMDKVRKTYEDAVKNEPPPYYFFESKKFRKIEDMLRDRDRSHDTRPETMKIPINKRFNFDTRICRQYCKSIYGNEKYSFKRIEVTHNDEIKELNVSSKPFRMGNYNLDLKDRNIPYFIDYFEKHKCNIHYPPFVNY